MALNTFEMWSNGIKIAFFSKKLRKIAKRLWALPSDPHSFRRLGAPPLDPRLWYVWITVHFFTKHTSTNLHILTIVLSILPWTSSFLGADTRPRLLTFNSTISLPLQKVSRSKFLMTSLHVIRGLGAPPPIKNPGYAYGLISGFQKVHYVLQKKKQISQQTNIVLWNQIKYFHLL